MGLKLLHKTHFTNALQLQLQAKLIPFEKYKYSTLIFFFFLHEIEIDVFFSLYCQKREKKEIIIG